MLLFALHTYNWLVFGNVACCHCHYQSKCHRIIVSCTNDVQCCATAVLALTSSGCCLTLQGNCVAMPYNFWQHCHLFHTASDQHCLEPQHRLIIITFPVLCELVVLLLYCHAVVLLLLVLQHLQTICWCCPMLHLQQQHCTSSITNATVLTVLTPLLTITPLHMHASTSATCHHMTLSL